MIISFVIITLSLSKASKTSEGQRYLKCVLIYAAISSHMFRLTAWRFFLQLRLVTYNYSICISTYFNMIWTLPISLQWCARSQTFSGHPLKEMRKFRGFIRHLLYTCRWVSGSEWFTVYATVSRFCFWYNGLDMYKDSLFAQVMALAPSVLASMY